MNLVNSELYQKDICETAALALPWEQLQGKNVLVAGATGLIGRCLIDVLMYKNRTDGLACHIYALGRGETSAREVLDENYFDSKDFTFIEQDVQKPLDAEQIPHVDVVFHMASNTHPAAYAKQPIDTILTNIYGTKNLLDFCAKCQAERFVFLSSVEIYGENRGDVELFSEGYLGYLDSNTMRAGYPESKRCGEALCQAYIAEKNVNAVIVRLPRVYGPTMKLEDSKAVAQFIKKSVNREDIVLKSEGNQHYSFLYVSDAVSGLLTATLKGETGAAYNVAEEKNDATLREMANILAEMAGKTVVFELPEETEKAGYSTATKARLDGAKMQALGWQPRYTVREGLEQTVRILRGM